MKYQTSFASLSGWRVYNNQTQTNDNSVNLAKNVTAGANGLTIMGKRESGYGKPFTSGELVGQGAQVVPNYFRAEIVGTFKDESGIWPALLWFRPVGNGDGEIDVMEWLGGLWSQGEKRVAITAHNQYGTGHAAIKKPMQLKHHSWYNPNVEHTYTIEKVPGSITVWVDGRKVASMGRADAGWWDRIMENRNKTWYPRITLQMGAGSKMKAVPNPSSSFRSTSVKVRSLKMWSMS